MNGSQCKVLPRISVRTCVFVCTFMCMHVLFRMFFVTSVVATGAQSTAVVALRHGQEAYSGDLCNAKSQLYLFIMCPCAALKEGL